MSLLELLEAHRPGTQWRFVLAALLWGLCGAAVVPLTNAAMALEPVDGAWWVLLVLTVAALGGLLVASRYATRVVVAATEGALGALWREAGERVAAAELRAIEPRPELADRLAGDLSRIGQAAQPALFTLQNGSSLLAATLIVGIVVPDAWLVWGLALGAVAWVAWPQIQRGRALGGAVARRRAELGHAVHDLMGGLLQVRLDQPTGDAVAAEVLGRAEAWHNENVEGDTQNVRGFLLGLLALYLLGFLPVIAAAPHLVDSSSAAAFLLLLALGFGPVLGLLFNLPTVLQAVEAAERVRAALDELGAAEPPVPADGPPPRWESVALVGAGYTYGGGGFRVGPVDLTLRPGELVFVTGGNGSGKTTLMKLLLGLYPVQMGELRWDGRRVLGESRARYRQLYTALFNEVTLFPRLYGVQASVEEVEALLQRLGLAGVVRYEGGRFTPLSLSTGQRKRLAMVVALLEDRPICVFDEWTANLDPETTRFYYDTLLPELKARGKAVLAVSHDDRYFDRADRILHLERGLVVAAPQPGVPPG